MNIYEKPEATRSRPINALIQTNIFSLDLSVNLDHVIYLGHHTSLHNNSLHFITLLFDRVTHLDTVLLSVKIAKIN